ncbi:MAG: FAD-dependent oxidoreductase [Desulfitobacterium sp.]
MSDSEKFDAIVVGGGVAGGVAAYVMAQAGLQVLLVERSNSAGGKNCTGGRLYSHSLEKIIPNFAAEAPIERKVTKERVSMTTESGAVTLDYSSDRLGEQGRDSYVVCRALFDRWLVDKAEEEGAMVACGIRVDDLIVRDGKVCGIIAGGEEMEAEVVVLADGVNSLLAEKIGLKKPVTPHQVAVGAKEVIELGEKEVESRFGLNGGEGMSWLFAGSVSDGAIGGGFLYTNKDSLSLGVVCTLADLEKANKTVPQMLNDLKEHPVVKPLIKGGKLVEYSGHLVPEAGISMIPTLYRDGVVVVGDAAGLVINIGYMVRGMDLAIESAKLAAETIIEAKAKNDFSANSLSSYKSKLDNSFVMKDLKQYQKFPHFLDETPRVFKGYPEMLDNMMADMFIVDGTPAEPLMKNMLGHVKKVGLMTLAKDGIKGVKAL